jgi:group I intron endonuclease
MFIYKITNKINGKIYIGKTIKPIEKRWKCHRQQSKRKGKCQSHLYSAIRKYGENNFILSLVEECCSEYGNTREQYWIKFYNSTNPSIGYNLTIGGDGGIVSEECKKKISDTLKEYYKNHTPFNPMKGISGESHPFYGKHHTNKAKEKLSVARKGKKYEDVMSIETAIKSKKKRSQRWKGKLNPSFKEIPMEEIIFQIHQFPLITSVDIAEKYNVSYATVIEKFKRFTGMTFENYKKEKMGFNHGVYKRLKHLGIDKSTWMKYSSDEQYKLSCNHE